MTRKLASNRSGSFAALAASIALLHACAVNPVSGDREFMLVSEDQEVAMGAEGATSVAKSIGLVEDAALQAYVNAIGQQLAADSERPQLPWSFAVVDDPTPNAFAFPGGYIFITRGLLALMNNEAELATVLGHEIGHVTARHSASMMSRAQAAQIGMGIGSILSPTLAQYSDLAAGGLQLLFLSYSRDAEREADDLGFQYALKHGYDVREMVNVFASLQHAGELAGASALPHWLASHPDPGDRIKRIDGKLGRLEQPMVNARVGSDDYMKHIDGLSFGANPRQGYFEDNRFLHPDMAFQVTFPKGWRTQNLPQVVIAGSPAQDAVVQLTVVAGSPEQAAGQFFAQPGLAAGRVETQSINGLRGVVGPFQADTQGGKITGRAAFIPLGNQTFRLLGFAPADKFAGHDKAFLASIGSFGRLTDKAALSRQPDRIVIVRPSQAMTLATFNQRFPSVVDIETLGLVNQLPDANASIPAKTPVKRIVRDK